MSPFADSIFVGFVLSTIFFGVTLLQAWNYALNNNDDWVASLADNPVSSALDIATTINNSLLIHIYLIQHFGDLFELTTTNVGFLVELSVAFVVVFLVQLSFASRVYLLSQKGYRFACAIAATACLGFVCNCYTLSEEIKHRGVADFTIRPIRVSVILGQSLVTIADGITTVVLTISILERLLAAIVARGVLVTVSNGLLILLYIFYPMKLYWIAAQLMQSKLYIITLSFRWAPTSASVLPGILSPKPANDLPDISPGLMQEQRTTYRHRV
ncbi:hypothetical protein CPC08DRAFT_768338 [Agrocybe pediades]|nr:hypothetical protein CPC08DRAFT_768338 [Agrocybe pediades]